MALPNRPFTPEQILAALRIALPDADEIFTRGRCFQLYLMLKQLWPSAVCWYDPIEGHVYTQIGQGIYDIKGAHTHLPPKADILSFESDPKLYAEAHTWRYHA